MILYGNSEPQYTRFIQLTLTELENMEDRMLKGVGKNIQRYREAAGYTQEGLAERVGISSNYLSALEREVKNPKLDTFVKIANAVGASADEILSDVLENKLKGNCIELESKLKKLPLQKQYKTLRILDVIIAEEEKNL